MSPGAGKPAPPEDAPPGTPSPSPGTDRLWTPWRMRYVAGGTAEAGCIFCNRLAGDDDVDALILHRGERAFVIMNLFPYNTGHVMVVPNAHVASPEDADEATMTEMSALRAPVLRSMRRALTPAGFNLGLNIGAVAGAGVTDHLHEHVVPRWEGDANFMPVLAATKVLPELIPVTYAKLRAELARELDGHEAAVNVVLLNDGAHVLVDDDGCLPRVRAEKGEPLWSAAIRDARERGATEAELIGWAGPRRAGDGPSVLLLGARANDDPGRALLASPVESLRHGADAALIDRIPDRINSA